MQRRGYAFYVFKRPSPPATEHHWHRHVTRARGHSRLQACSGVSSIGHSRTEFKGTRDYKRAAACQASVTHALVTRSEATNNRPSNGYGQPSQPATEHHWHRHVTRARGNLQLQACSGVSSVGHSHTEFKGTRGYKRAAACQTSATHTLVTRSEATKSRPSDGYGQPTPPATEHHWHHHVTRARGHLQLQACSGVSSHGHSRTGHSVRSYQQPSLQRLWTAQPAWY
ncbi:hypothetical protein J6590_037268 [Homalodisca vitripennis]|nr:hypothetical protein J6590_037268 [Homalodisca vitripennis]